MDPRAQFCHNEGCPARGERDGGNIAIHSRKEERYRCRVCGRTFAGSRGTALYRLHKPTELFVVVVALLCHGCPPQAIVAAFGLDERTVASWLMKAGVHCERVHEHLVRAGQVELGCVQADATRKRVPGVKLVGRRVWMAMALCVPSRLWLGGVVSERRDRGLVGALALLVRASGRAAGVLVCTDGLRSYVGAFRRAWRKPVYTGRVGRPRLVEEEGLLVGQMVKRYERRRVVGVFERVAIGAREAIEEALAATGAGNGVNTAYIERLNATFRARLAPLVRRTRGLVRREEMLVAGMWLVGTAYNLCREHHSLRRAAGIEDGVGREWVERTPAMAAGLTDHVWRVEEVLRYRVPLPAYIAPKRRGRPPNAPPARLAA